jgi:hypothetical protein
LYCANNQLTGLHVSNNTAKTVLYCFTNQLSTLDISNNTSLTNIQIRENPSLTEVCVWVVPFPPEGVTLDVEGITTIDFTTDCSE